MAHDIGVALGCGASIKSLIRLASGPFTVSSASTVEELEYAAKNRFWQTLVFPIDFPVLESKAGMVDEDKELAIKQGQSVYIGLANLKSSHDAPILRMYNLKGDFFALMRQDRVRGKWRASKVFNLTRS